MSVSVNFRRKSHSGATSNCLIIVQNVPLQSSLHIRELLCVAASGVIRIKVDGSLPLRLRHSAARFRSLLGIDVMDAY
jgi:vancomycin permeability regulator SanA